MSADSLRSGIDRIGYCLNSHCSIFFVWQKTTFVLGKTEREGKWYPWLHAYISFSGLCARWLLCQLVLLLPPSGDVLSITQRRNKIISRFWPVYLLPSFGNNCRFGQPNCTRNAKKLCPKNGGSSTAVVVIQTRQP